MNINNWLLIFSVFVLVAVLFTEPPPCEPCECERRADSVSTTYYL
jgi:hypothetical protein